MEAMVVLGAIATLLDDRALLDAALSEILSMPPQDRRRLDRLRKVDALLLRHHLMTVRTRPRSNNCVMNPSLILEFVSGLLE